jgi:hypothetical protein
LSYQGNGRTGGQERVPGFVAEGNQSRTEFLQNIDIGLTSQKCPSGTISADQSFDRSLHALRHREGMGKPGFPPQGVGTPVLFGAKKPRPPLAHSSLLPQEYVCAYEERKNHRDDSVHGEEGGVEPG